MQVTYVKCSRAHSTFNVRASPMYVHTWRDHMHVRKLIHGNFNPTVMTSVTEVIVLGITRLSVTCGVGGPTGIRVTLTLRVGLPLTPFPAANRRTFLQCPYRLLDPYNAQFNECRRQ